MARDARLSSSLTTALRCALLLLAPPLLGAQPTQPPTGERASSAKETAPRKPGEQDLSTPLFELQTVDHDLVLDLLNLLRPFTQLESPDIAESDHLHLTIPRTGEPELRGEDPPTADADGSRLVFRLRAAPGPLLASADSLSKTLAGLIRSACFFYLVTVSKTEPRYAAIALKGLSKFPAQLAQIRLDVHQRPGGPNNRDIALEIEPKPGTWLDTVVRGLKPSSRGAHVFRTPRPALSLTAAVEGPGLQTLLAPLGTTLANLRGRSKADRRAFQEVVRERLPWFDGSISILVDGPGRYVRLVGLRQAPQFLASTQSPSGGAFDRRRMGRADTIPKTEVPEPLRGQQLVTIERELDFLETATEEAEDELTTFTGVLRDFSLKTRGPADGKETARLVTRIERRRLRRMPLLDQALLSGELNFGQKLLLRMPGDQEVLDTLRQFTNQEALSEVLESLPNHASFRLHKRGTKERPTLRLEIHTR